MNALGARVRLVKGAYKEAEAVAYPKKADVDAAYARMMKALLTDGHYPAIATHDPAMIELARDWARDARHRARPVRVPDAVRRPPRSADDAGQARATACASTSRSAANGFLTSCGGWASGRPMSCSSSAASSGPWVAAFRRRRIRIIRRFELSRLFPTRNRSGRGQLSAAHIAQLRTCSALSRIRPTLGTPLDIT